MQTFKHRLSVAAIAGSLSGCTIGNGGTDTLLTITTTATATATETGTGSGTDGTGSGTDGTGTTDMPTTSASTTSSTTGGPAKVCGWNSDTMFYECGFEGQDPNGAFPIACPPDLMEGAPCNGLTGAGCCDDAGDNWYCGDDEMGGTFLVLTTCD